MPTANDSLPTHALRPDYIAPVPGGYNPANPQRCRKCESQAAYTADGLCPACAGLRIQFPARRYAAV